MLDKHNSLTLVSISISLQDLLSFAGDGDASEVLPALQPDESFFSNNADELMPTTVLSNGYSQTNSATEDSDKIQITAEQSDQSVMINENDVNEATVEKTFNFQVKTSFVQFLALN